MTILFLDTNVLLDVLLKRAPHYPDSTEVWNMCERGGAVGYVSIISFNNTFYIARKLRGTAGAYELIHMLRNVYRPIPFDEQILDQSISSGLADFEDAIQYHSAIRAGADCLLTRNVSHFPKAPLSVLTPAEFLATSPQPP